MTNRDTNGMRPTGWTDLLPPFVVLGAAVYVALRFAYDALPPLSWVIPLPLAALAVVEVVVARRVRAVVRHDPRAKPMTAIAIARAVALGKASALVGAAVAGASAGLLGQVLPSVGVVTAAAHDAAVGGVLFVVCAALVAAALLLERAGTDPNRGRNDKQRSTYP